MITKEEIAKLCELSRIEIKGEEKEKLQKDSLVIKFTLISAADCQSQPVGSIVRLRNFLQV
jgi:Asp-tRNA(Asn)/Glu-tRNA(Gln) amidotransferase C subunit